MKSTPHAFPRPSAIVALLGAVVVACVLQGCDAILEKLDEIIELEGLDYCFYLFHGLSSRKNKKMVDLTVGRF